MREESKMGQSFTTNSYCVDWLIQGTTNNHCITQPQEAILRVGPPVVHGRVEGRAASSNGMVGGIFCTDVRVGASKL